MFKILPLKKIFFSLFFFLLSFQIFSFPILALGNNQCVLENKSIELKWTAFKTTKKVPVTGTFKNIELIKINNSNPTSEVHKWLTSYSFSFDVKSVDTQNPQRDKTLTDNFFGLFKTSLEYLPGSILITGKVKTIDPNNQTLIALLNVNAINKEVPLKFSFQNNTLELIGSIDLLDFGLNEAYSKLHTACLDLHKGEDGVSKTWTQVDLMAKVEFVPCELQKK
jgi:hypothetical protein